MAEDRVSTPPSILRVAEPKQLGQQQDFNLQANGTCTSEDPQKLPVRVVTSVKAAFRTLLQKQKSSFEFVTCSS